MAEIERRLTRLETQLAPDEARLVWADMHNALAWLQARARLAVCHRLDVDARDPRVIDAMSWLGGDDPALVTQDVETIARWRRQQGIPAEAGEARQRLAKEKASRKIDGIVALAMACVAAVDGHGQRRWNFAPVGT